MDLKRVLLGLLCLGLTSLGETAHPPSPYNDNCIIGQFSVYNQSMADEVPWFTIDLDTEPSQRWKPVVDVYRGEIQALLDLVRRQLTAILPNIFHVIDNWMSTWITNVRQPYRDEIQSLADMMGVPVGEMVFFNMFYEINAACTSIVAETPSGQIYHARNLDFGLFIGWNTTSHEWLLTEKLRNTMINVEWTRNGKTVFKSLGFAGYIGIFNGLRPGAFSITMDTRHTKIPGFIGIMKWLLMLTPKAQFDTWNVRDVLMEAEDFDQAVDRLSNDQLITSCYYIVGGVKHQEGAIIVREPTDIVLTKFMNETESGWYVLETNYDPNKDAWWLDDRRTPGNNCMNQLSQGGVGMEGIMNVLSSKTTLNKLTVYSCLMHVESGTLEAYKQHCADPCWAW